MKKTLSLILALLLIIGLLPGCEQDMPATEPKTEGTAATTPSTAEPATQPATAPTTQPTTEPATEPTTEPTTEPVTEPATEPATEPVTEPTTEPTEPPHTHSYTSEVTSPTCERHGYTTYTCACGDEYTGDIVAPTGHAYTSEVIAPTCEEVGYTVYTCSCGDSYKVDYTAPHPNRQIMDYGDNAGWGEDELFIIYICMDCGKIWMKTFESLDEYNEELSNGTFYEEPDEETEPVHEHKYDKVVTEPTCKEWGYTVHTCSCGDSYKTDYTAPHPNRKVIEYGESDGLQGYYYYIMFECPDCGSVYMQDFGNDPESRNEELLEYGITADPVEHVHSYTSEDAEAPTCTEWGCITHTCECGYYYIEDLAPTGHDYVTTTVEPTAESEGYDLHACKNCGDSYKDNYTDKLPSADEEETNAPLTAPDPDVYLDPQWTKICIASYAGETIYLLFN